VAEIAAGEALGKPIEIWFCDEARVGQKNKITRRWAKRGTRPSAPKDQRTQSAYIFGAICPAEGKGAGLVLPRCTSEGMSLHLEEISRAVRQGPTPWCCSIRRDGTSPSGSWSPPTSPSCRCPPKPLS
jgi:hypothetical protein